MDISSEQASKVFYELLVYVCSLSLSMPSSLSHTLFLFSSSPNSLFGLFWLSISLSISVRFPTSFSLFLSHFLVLSLSLSLSFPSLSLSLYLFFPPSLSLYSSLSLSPLCYACFKVLVQECEGIRVLLHCRLSNFAVLLEVVRSMLKSHSILSLESTLASTLDTQRCLTRAGVLCS